MNRGDAVRWLETGLNAVIVAAGLLLAVVFTTGIVRVLAAAVAALTVGRWLFARPREWDERELFLNYVAGSLVHLATLAGLLLLLAADLFRHGAADSRTVLLLIFAGGGHALVRLWVERRG